MSVYRSIQEDLNGSGGDFHPEAFVVYIWLLYFFMIFDKNSSLDKNDKGIFSVLLIFTSFFLGNTDFFLGSLALMILVWAVIFVSKIYDHTLVHYKLLREKNIILFEKIEYVLLFIKKWKRSILNISSVLTCFICYKFETSYFFPSVVFTYIVLTMQFLVFASEKAGDFIETIFELMFSVYDKVFNLKNHNTNNNINK